jgi:hypothetical protein
MRPLKSYEPSQGAARQRTRAPIPHSQGDGQLALDLHIGPSAPRAAEPPANAPLDRKLIGRMITTILEACQGHRPIGQVRPLLETGLYHRLLTGEPLRGQPYIVRSVHTCRPADGAVETCATVHSGSRAFAIAARFETTPSGWRCTRFELLNPRATRHRMSA